MQDKAFTADKWHFQKHDDGWSWRCTRKDRVEESERRFATIVDAVADAGQHGYAAATAHIGSIGPLPNKWAQLGAAPKPEARSGGRSQAALVIRRDVEHGRWTWELRAPDGRLLNRSAGDFDTREECEADAARNGLTA